MAETFVNSFLLGADPELAIIDPPTLINGQKTIRRHPLTHYGWDHNGWVVEPHPAPSQSARTVCANIKKSLDVLANDFPEYRFRAGAYYNCPQTREVTLGGHVHLDIPTLSDDQLGAMDNFHDSLLFLGILPPAECVVRASKGNYGFKGDARFERGRSEYRRMCSWLYSRKASMLAITGIKLAAVAPTTVKPMRSITSLRSWLEDFKGKDDDVDWILDRGYFDKSMEAKPDDNVKSVWKVDPNKAKEWRSEVLTKPVEAAPPTGLNFPGIVSIHRLVERGIVLSPVNRDTLAREYNRTGSEIVFAHLQMDNANRIAHNELELPLPMRLNRRTLFTDTLTF